MVNDSQTVGRRILTDDEMRRALVRIAHEVLERNGGAEDVVLIGMHTRGVPIAHRIAAYVKDFEGDGRPCRDAGHRPVPGRPFGRG